MSKKLTTFIEFICAGVFYFISLLVRRKPVMLIIYYHSVPASHLSQFEKHMRYLAEHCCVFSISQIKKIPIDANKPVISITFDDGFDSVFHNALPVLKKYNLPSAVFVPSGLIGKARNWKIYDSSDDEMIMNEKQIKSAALMDCEILSHTVTHSNLSSLDDKCLREELIGSKLHLEKITGKDVKAVSYPYGGFNKSVCQAAKEAGYSFGFTIEPKLIGKKTDDYQIGRFAVSTTDNMLKFRFKVTGAYVVSEYLRFIKKKVFSLFSSQNESQDMLLRDARI